MTSKFTFHSKFHHRLSLLSFLFISTHNLKCRLKFIFSKLDWHSILSSLHISWLSYIRTDTGTVLYPLMEIKKLHLWTCGIFSKCIEIFSLRSAIHLHGKFLLHFSNLNCWVKNSKTKAVKVSAASMGSHVMDVKM